MAPPEFPPTLIRKEDLPPVLAILPLRNSVFFPGGVLPLAVGRQKTIALIKDAVTSDALIGVVTQRRAELEDPGVGDLYAMGTVSRIVKLLKMGEVNYSLVVQGLARFRVLELIQETPYLKARIEPADDESVVGSTAVEALGINLKKLAVEVIKLMPELPAAATELVESITYPGHLADLLAANVDISLAEKQAVLDAVPLLPRMRLVLDFLATKREILLFARRVEEAVKARASETEGRRLPLRAALELLRERRARSGTARGGPEFKLHPVIGSQGEVARCSFCGRAPASDELLLQGGTASICERCLAAAAEMVLERTGPV